MIKTKAWKGKIYKNLSKKQAQTIKALAAQRVELKAQIVELQTTNARLQKISRNSSKLPSSDMVKPKTKEAKETGGKKRNIFQEVCIFMLSIACAEAQQTAGAALIPDA